eukprot:5723877-Pleurochrysis_carterae.AAC.1
MHGMAGDCHKVPRRDQKVLDVPCSAHLEPPPRHRELKWAISNNVFKSDTCIRKSICMDWANGGVLGCVRYLRFGLLEATGSGPAAAAVRAAVASPRRRRSTLNYGGTAISYSAVRSGRQGYPIQTTH